MSLAQTLRKNAKFVKDYQNPGQAIEATAPACLVVADSNPALTGIIEPALGLAQGQATMIRIAGAWGGKDGEELARSAALALHLDECREVYVVGFQACSACLVDRKQIQEKMKAAGLLEKFPDGGAQLIDRMRGPGSPELAVQETVKLLRKRLAPRRVPVHGCMLDPATGALKVINADRSTESVPISQAKEPAVDLDFALPELPEIVLPEIPSLDLSAIDVPAPAPPPIPQKKAEFSYGKKSADSGPISFDEMKNLAPASVSSLGSIQADYVSTIHTPDVEFHVPESVQIQDTGMQALPNVEERAEHEAIDAVQAKKAQATKQDVTANKKIRAAQTLGAFSRPQTAEPAASPPSTPLGEQVFDFSSSAQNAGQSNDEEVEINLSRGYVSHRGSEYPLDPALQNALLKVKSFLATELATKYRRHIGREIAQGLASGKATGSLLKLLIGPVLKLGKKRYAVINELLKIKEDLPRLAPAVAAAILQDILA